MQKTKLFILSTIVALLFTSVWSPVFANENAVNNSETAQLLKDRITKVEGNTITFDDNTYLVQKEDHFIATDINGNEYKVTKINEDKVKYENLKTVK